jgi:hypothetical protein
MTSQRSTTSDPDGRGKRQDGGPGQSDRPAIGAAIEEARGALQGMGRSMPEVARASRSAVDEALRAIEGGSDARLSAGVALSLGLTIGLLIGGAPRLLVALALLPLAAMGLALADRRGARAASR